MLLDGKETAVYLEVSDTEINFWDSASGGKLLAVAKYPETFAGAANALKSCDYTDLDEDGNSDLTAKFTFAGGSTASLVWFYADGGLVYNEEFSRLPGEATAAGTNETSKHFIFRMARAFCTGSEWGGASVPAFAEAAVICLAVMGHRIKHGACRRNLFTRCLMPSFLFIPVSDIFMLLSALAHGNLPHTLFRRRECPAQGERTHL